MHVLYPTNGCQILRCTFTKLYKQTKNIGFINREKKREVEIEEQKREDEKEDVEDVVKNKKKSKNRQKEIIRNKDFRVKIEGGKTKKRERE